MRSLVLLLCTVATLSAADFTGSWNLDTEKSKYEGMPAPKEQTVTYTVQGTGYEYMAVGTSATGDPIHAMFTYVKDGEEAKATGFPYWDAVVIKHGTSEKTEVEFKRAGKSVGSATRVLEKDGKSLVISGKLTLPDGEKATYKAVYMKQ